MLVRRDQAKIFAGEQDQRGAQRRGLENPRRDLADVVLGFHRVGVDAKFLERHRAAPGRRHFLVFRPQRAVEVEHVGAGLRTEIGAAGGDEIVPRVAIKPLVIGPFDVVRDAARLADFAHAVADLELLDTEPAVIGRQPAAAIADMDRPLAQWR